MKKLVYFVATLFLFSSNLSYANSNEACTDGSKFLVLQVLDNGVLGYICPQLGFI